jgi:hypothetical protein
LAALVVIEAYVAYQSATVPAGEFILVADDDHAYVAATAGVTKVLGYTPPDLVGMGSTTSRLRTCSTRQRRGGLSSSSTVDRTAGSSSVPGTAASCGCTIRLAPITPLPVSTSPDSGWIALPARHRRQRDRDSATVGLVDQLSDVGSRGWLGHDRVIGLDMLKPLDLVAPPSPKTLGAHSAPVGRRGWLPASRPSGAAAQRIPARLGIVQSRQKV